jgi:hypothetical protein
MINAQNRLYMGYSLVAFTLFDVVICLGIVVVQIMALAARKLKLKYLALA